MSSFPNLDIRLCAQNGNPNPALFGDCGTLFPNNVGYLPPFTSPSTNGYIQYVLNSPVPLLSGSAISIKMCSSSTTAPTAYLRSCGSGSYSYYGAGVGLARFYASNGNYNQFNPANGPIPCLSVVVSETVLASSTSTPTPSRTPTPTPTSSPSSTVSSSETPTPTSSLQPATSPSNTPSPSPTTTLSPTPTPSPTGTITLTPTGTIAVSPTGTVSITPTPTVSVTPTPTASETPPPTVSVTPTPTVSVSSVSVSATSTLQPSGGSATSTPTATITPTLTISATQSPTDTPSRTSTESMSPTVSVSATSSMNHLVTTITSSPSVSSSTTLSSSNSVSPRASFLGDVPASNQASRPQSGFSIAEIAGISVGGIAVCVICIAILSFCRTGRKSPKSLLHAKPSEFGERVFTERGVVGSRAVKIQVNPNPEASGRQGRIMTAMEGRRGRN